jgi:Mrp family chromosome partitioning ATPase
VIFVIRVGKTAHDVLRRVVDQIETVKGRIMGVVLNRADLRRDGYYHYYRAYQRYYDADEDGSKR